jgi:CRP-like cAMP-binding protein/small-conductance mechanosensitive channel
LESIGMDSWAFPAFWLESGALAEIWRAVQATAELDSVWQVCAVFMLSAALLAFLARNQRRRIRVALLMFLGAVLLILGSAVAAGLGGLAAAKTIHAVGLLLGGFAIVKLASVFVFDVVLHAVHLSPDQILRDILVAFGYLGVGLSLLSRSGVSLSGLVATSAVMTGVIVFSLQDSLSSLLGGLVLEAEKSISVGDWVKIDQMVGRVVEMNWRHLTVETRNWETVIIPNSVLMKTQLMVLGRRTAQPTQWRRWVWFNVDFRIPPTEVVRVVTEALHAEPVEGAASEPKPNCVLMDFKESYCQYAARYWLSDLAADDTTDSRVRARVYFALQRAGIPLSVPAFRAFVEEQSQERKQLHHEREIQQRLGALNLAHVELFETLNEEERRKVVERLRYAAFAKGEVMTRQGAEAHWLYILTKGSAEVLLSLDSGETKEVSTLRAGDFFGEMSLLTGEPRSATVKALEDSECYRLDRQAFEDILRARPEITQHLSEVLARRKVELEAVRHDLDAAAQAKMIQHQQRSIFDSIYKLFKLFHAPKAQPR